MRRGPEESPVRVEPASFSWSGEQDGPASVVRRVAAAAAAVDGRDPLNESTTLTLAGRGLEDAALYLSGDDGFAYLHGLSTSAPELDLAVAPESRRHGRGAALLRAALALHPRPVTAWSHGDHPGAAALATKAGFRAVRELWVMRRSLADAQDGVPPPGFTLRAFRPGADDAAFLALNAQAFASHPEQGALDQRGLDERTSQDWFDPAGFLLAERDGRLVGFHWTKTHPGSATSPAVGEVYVIGVGPSTQGTGLGRALLSAGLRHLQSRGLTDVLLYVEADNTPAVRMYERQGFTHDARDTDVQYLRP